MTFLPSQFNFNELPGNTIVPELDPEEVFVQYLTRLYEDIAFAVNNKDNISFTIPIGNVAADIPVMPNFGAFLICVSGVDDGMPAYVWALAKNNANLAGTTPAALTNQVGTIAPWVGVTLTVTSTLTNYQIQHSGTVTGNFNIRIVSTF